VVVYRSAQNVRTKIAERVEQSDGKTGSREQNFDLIHYRAIIEENWGLLAMSWLWRSQLEESKRTEWIQEVGQMRNTVMHLRGRQYLSFEKLDRLRELRTWLDVQVVRASR